MASATLRPCLPPRSSLSSFSSLSTSSTPALFVPRGSRRGDGRCSRLAVAATGDRASGGGKGEGDEDDDDKGVEGGGASSSSSSRAPPPPPWWEQLSRVHILVFNPDTEREAIYTTSRRSADFAANDFVAFEAVADAARAAVRISDQLGEMPVVDAVDPRVMTFLASQCGYGVDVVPSGTPFDPPATVIDQVGGDGASLRVGGATSSVASPVSSSAPGDELAISTADLQRYLVNGGALTTAHADGDGEEDGDGVGGEQLDAARRRAAVAMQMALRSPVSRVQSSIRGAAGLPRGREALDAAWGEEVPMPRAASAVYRALVVIAERRLRDADALAQAGCDEKREES